MSLGRSAIGTFAGIAVAIAPIPAMADTPASLGDLVGARGSSGEEEMHNRGYEVQSTKPASDGIYSYWWNKSDDRCVRVLTSDGRYSSIDSASKSDCGKGGGSNAAAVAVGAAALIGIAALAASSRKDSNKYYDSRATAEYDRGYRDGYNHLRYNNYNRSDAYADGYSAGIDRGGYRPSFGSNYTGYSDLIGRSNDYADRQLRMRGYIYQGKNSLGSGHERHYWQQRIRQCIAVRTRSSTVEYIMKVRRRDCR